MSDSIWLLGLFGAAALLMLAHRQGLRLNAVLARSLARELEEALAPADATYTWIGGAIGFHAVYELDDGRTVKATATFLPRHSPLYLPVAWIVSGRSDRLQLTLEQGKRVEGHAHLFSRSYLRHRFADRDALAGLAESRLEIAGRPFVGCSSSKRLRRWLGKLAELVGQEVALPRRLRHVALTGGESTTLYVLLAPSGGAAPKAARLLCDLGRGLDSGLVEEANALSDAR